MQKFRDQHNNECWREEAEIRAKWTAPPPVGINLDLHGGDVESIQYVGGRLGPSDQQEAPAIAERDGAAAPTAQLLERVRAGYGDSLFIVAEAPLGKSAVLDMARQSAGSDIRIGAKVAEPGDATEPFGFLRAAIDEIDD
ncbi:MAG TPA: hypothetical protein VGL32_03010, partial [Acidimicrobiales bacterium]